MAVMLRRQRDGAFRPFWYGEYSDANGQRVVTNLNVAWRGTPPASGRFSDPGDAPFEKSREKAREELAKFKDSAVGKGHAAHLTERLIEIKTGAKVAHVRIAELAGKWAETRTKVTSAAHAQGTKSACERFRAFMAKRNPAAVYLYEVRPADATAFYQDLCSSMAPRTAHGYTAMIRSACRRFLPEGAVNPFRDVTLSGGNNSVHRKPFTVEELQLILEQARGDSFLHPLIVTAACSGMRRGDVCRLRWADVDLAGGMLTVKASKTGEPLEIPIFGPLRETLAGKERDGGEFVFPEAVRMIEKNPDGLSYRFKKVVALALDPEGGSPTPPHGITEAVPAEDVAEEGRTAILARVKEGPRRERILEVFERYSRGESYRDIEKALGTPRATVSGYLHAVEEWIGKRFVKSDPKPSVRAAIDRVTRVDRTQGMLSASVRDWHALRTTFVTLALSAGVPIELVKRVTGHTTVDVVLRHYFRPWREAFRSALLGAMPAVLTGEAEKLETGNSKQVLAKPQRPQSEVAVLAGKVAAGAATAAEKARLGKLLGA